MSRSAESDAPISVELLEALAEVLAPGSPSRRREAQARVVSMMLIAPMSRCSLDADGAHFLHVRHAHQALLHAVHLQRAHAVLERDCANISATRACSWISLLSPSSATSSSCRPKRPL